MSTDWSENPPKKCWGTKVLVPFQADQQVFCFNLKNGLQKYEYILFVKCLYVFYTKPGYIETLPAQNEHALLRKPSKKRQGHQSSGARAPEFWCLGTRSLVPFQADKQVFCFNFKNGLQNYDVLLFANCIYVFYTKPGFSRAWSAWMSMQ